MLNTPTKKLFSKSNFALYSAIIVTLVLEDLNGNIDLIP